MSEIFMALSTDDRREALELAAANSGRPIHLLEKDVWVVWTLNALFRAPFGKDLVFKGGTSLSKAYGIIERFSEDIDVTYDIRAIAPDVTGTDPEPVPMNPSQLKKWRKLIDERLPAWINDVVRPQVQACLEADNLTARLRAEADCLFLDYEPLAMGTGYVAPTIRVEFGAKSTGEPSTDIAIECDAAKSLPSLVFPTAKPRVLKAERTFWEKATAAHAYCLNGTIRGRGAYARHWYDLAKMDGAGVTECAKADTALALAVAHHKAAFFVERTEEGPVDYEKAVTGGLRLVPLEGKREKLEADYLEMIRDGLLPEPVDSFDILMDKAKAIETKLNTESAR
jgi:hypothetical protein